MKLNDLKNVCESKCMITVLAFFNTGEYYSFRTYNDAPVYLKDCKPDVLDLDVDRIISVNNCLHIDVREII